MVWPERASVELIGGVLIESVLSDPVGDSRVEPERGSATGERGFADGGGGAGVGAGDDVQPVTFSWNRFFAAGEDDEFDGFGEDFRMRPARQRVPLVAAHDPEKPVVWEPLGHHLGRLIGERWLFAFQFVVVDEGPTQMRRGELEHFQPVLAASGMTAGFVRRDTAGEKPDLIERQRVFREDREMDMPEVNRIEGASEQRDFSGRGHVGILSVARNGRQGSRAETG